MKKYFLYELKKNAFAIGIIAFVVTALYLTIVLSAYNLGYSENNIYLWVAALAGGVLAAAVPVWMFSYKMKKRSVDLYYSLPLSHTKILAVKYLIGLIAVFAPYVVSYWLGAFTVMAKTVYNIYPVYYLAHFFASVIPIYIIYAMSAFVFTRANRKGDGIMFIVFWAFALVAVLAVPRIFTLQYLPEHPYVATSNIHPFLFAPYSPLNIVTTVFQHYIARSTYTFADAEWTNFIIGAIVNTLLAAAATFGIFYFERQAKAENTEQISDSVFGYKVMIPLYSVCLTAISDMTIILIVLIVIGSYCLTAIYKRTLKIGQKQTIILIASLVAGIIISAIYHYAF